MEGLKKLFFEFERLKKYIFFMETKTIDSLIEETKNIIHHPKFALTFLLFEFFPVISRTSEAVVFKRCHQVLHETRCNLANCRWECFFKFRSYRGLDSALAKVHTNVFASMIV